MKCRASPAAWRRARQQPDDRARLRAPRRSQRPERGGPVGARSHQHELREDAERRSRRSAPWSGRCRSRRRRSRRSTPCRPRSTLARQEADSPDAVIDLAAGAERHRAAIRCSSRRRRHRDPQRHRGLGAGLASAGGRMSGGAAVPGARASRSSSPIADPASPRTSVPGCSSPSSPTSRDTTGSASLAPRRRCGRIRGRRSRSRSAYGRARRDDRPAAARLTVAATQELRLRS